MASNYQLQSVLPTCKHHVNEQLNYYCQTCHLRVCEECCHVFHRMHKWMSNKKFATWIRQNKETRCQEIEDMIKEPDGEVEEIKADICRIEEVRRKWILVINDAADSMIEKRKDRRSSKISTGELTMMKKMLKFFKTDINEADDKVALEMEEEFHKKKQNLPSQKKLKLEEGEFSADVIQKMFGDVEEITTATKVNILEKSNFTHVDESDMIYHIVPLPNDEALIKRPEGEQHIYHVDMKGIVMEKLPAYSGIFVMLNSDIIFSGFRTQNIRRVTPSGTEIDIYSTAPLYPDGMCISYDGGLLVALCSCDNTEITSDTYGEVHHIDTSGGIINKYSHTEEGKSRLFISPTRVAQNKNTDLCVVEFMDREGRSRLVGMSLSSQIKFTYTGQPDLKENFSCNDIACDHRGRILLTDIDNDAIHLLSENGHFLQYVLTEKSPLWGPQSLGIYGDTLWVGCEKGVVRVYAYKDEE